MKSTTQWRSRYGRGLIRLRNELAPKPVTCYGVYNGERPLATDDYTVLPVTEFLRRLWDGEVVR